ncbi:BTB domain-containing protein [Fusarium keratoplasticum]|uniref:BTB domain-containing protein n=1 Tax=Fusarium keratoplasticum TaxID=1328300 RepID=A0ACC0R6R5_9HYPO|nr:BTB domain-containing protein [Fusarium keratoplasticum]KAI8664495.1 BTB domain-containing protein [Fusarium keratoplasticum]KAI8675869.1 BTB domain-containing protein [Fusarium keratoplasticum]
MASEPYFNQDTLSDLSVTCDGQTFKVHRLILCAHSKYFSKQLNGPWKESSEQVINIQDFDVGVVEAMLHFMYNFDYTNVNGTSSMVFEAQIYQIADKYDIDSLKEHATKRFGAALDIGWPMDDFPLAITVAYTTSPLEDRGLRDLIIETSSQHIDDLLGKGYFCEVLRTTNDFAADLVPFLRARQAPDVKKYRCPSCRKTFYCSPSSGEWHCPLFQGGRDNWKQFQL